LCEIGNDAKNRFDAVLALFLGLWQKRTCAIRSVNA
jgi:hypothetical protein